MTTTAPHLFTLERIGAGLPVARAAEQITQAADAGALVVTAPPGTGKTTLVPPMVANLVSARGGGSTLVTQPRRVAVRAAARRIATLDGTRLGGPVGFTVRGERTVGPGTVLEMLTPGVLLRRLIDDPTLDGVGAVILDEVHERSLETDLLLGMLAEVRELREDLLVVAMSATVDADAVASLLGADEPAPIVDVPSALHELSVEYAPPEGPRLDARGVPRAMLEHVAAMALEGQRRLKSDALVFLPGAREVDETIRMLRALVGDASNLDVLPLHGRLPAAQQDRATAGRGPQDPPRIVVSTALAESSLTVPGVHLVVDAGFSREVRRDRGRDMSGLVTVSCSRASAEQRAGRAARLGPGTVIRTYSPTDFARMPTASPPEITSSDLTDAALLLAAWGTPGGKGLRLLTPPPSIEMDAAISTLRTLGVVGEDGRPTALGETVARLPVGVREARALLDGARRVGPRAAAEVVAALSGDLRADGADLPALLRTLRSGRGARGSDGGTRGADGAARGGDADGPRTRWQRDVQRLEQVVRKHVPREGAGPSAATRPADPAHSAGDIIALARPERIARRIAPNSRTLLLASGTRAALPEGSSLLGHEWLTVWEVQRAQGRAADGTGAVVRLAAPLSDDAARELAGDLLVQTRAARIEQGQVRVRLEQRLGAIVLSSTPVAATAEDRGPALAAHLREHGLDELEWSPAATNLRARLALLHRELGAPWPAMDEASLLEQLDVWLGPDLASAAGGSLRSIDVAQALRRLLPWPEAAHFDELVPERLPAPSGSTVRLEYPALWDGADAGGDVGAGTEGADAADAGAEAGEPRGEKPQVIAAVKLQEVFGLAESPRLLPAGASGGVPVVFHLLSPARRPLAVTADLRSFWDGPYAQVRKEMRGRYPKHPWPEDPWTAPATARTTRRM